MTSFHSGPSHAPSQLTIDLSAIQDNYRILCKQAGGKKTSAVVKANGYGLGARQVAQALWEAGCRTFFTALLDEAIEVRAALPEAEIGVLNGLLPGQETVFADYGLMPTLNDLGQIGSWNAFCGEKGQPLPASIHLDTGMARLGLPPYELVKLQQDPGLLGGFDCRYYLSHLACADEPDRPMNRNQKETFAEAISKLPPAIASLAASSGTFLGTDWHFDMIRPGVALFGGNPQPGRENPMKQVVRLQGKILQIREIDAGQAVGYGAHYRASEPRRIATVAAGYADGYIRSLSERAAVRYEGVSLPVVGRVSMDLITVDVTKVPGVDVGGLLDLIGPGQDINDLADRAGTIPYEILTNLGMRYRRTYIGE